MTPSSFFQRLVHARPAHSANPIPSEHLSWAADAAISLALALVPVTLFHWALLVS